MSNQGAAVTLVNGRSMTQTVITVDSTGVLLLAANPGRTCYGLMVIDAQDVTLGYDSIPTAGSGWILGAASGAGKQGGSDTAEGTGIPTNAIYGRTVTSTARVTVREGIGG